MNIVIAGGGKVGEALCSELSSEGNDIILIEKNSKRMDALINKYDITGIVGNGANYDLQMEASVPNCDIFIGVTPQDEINIMSAVIAKKLGAKHTIARVRNPEYTKHLGFVKDSLGITMMINPELESAKDIMKVIKYPTALSVESFAGNRVNLVELKIKQNSPLVDISLKDFKTRYGNILVAIIQRGDEIIIPSGENYLREGDRIYVVSSLKEVNKFYKLMGDNRARMKSALIIGGGRITYYLINMLKDYKMDIKVIENNAKRAEELSEAFPGIMVVHGDGTDQEFLEEERIEGYDVFISLTGVDEENIITSLYASQQGVRKSITKVNRTLLLKIFGTMGLQTVITPKRVIANTILQFVRSLTNQSVSNVEALFRLADNQVEALQFKVKASSRVVNVPLESLPIKSRLLIAYIIRGKKLIVPGGQDIIKTDDHVIVITTEKNYDDIDDILK